MPGWKLQWYLFGAAFLLAAAYTLKQNEHIRIDIDLRHVLAAHPALDRPFRARLLPDALRLLMISTSSPISCCPGAAAKCRPMPGGLIIWPAKAMLLIGFILLAPGRLRDHQEDRRHART
jgi:TRAP-type mannitol/chloroaromatic compound transport system permease small subunit